MDVPPNDPNPERDPFARDERGRTPSMEFFE